MCSASDDLFKTASKQVKNVRGVKKVKNISEVSIDKFLLKRPKRKKTKLWIKNTKI